MTTTLRVEGQRTEQRDPKTNLAMVLYAHYNDTQYVFSRLTTTPSALLLHFSHADGQTIPDGINIIIATVLGDGIDRACGISEYSEAGRSRDCYSYAFAKEFHSLGKDLEIIVEPQADEIIRSMTRADIVTSMGRDFTSYK